MPRRSDGVWQIRRGILLPVEVQQAHTDWDELQALAMRVLNAEATQREWLGSRLMEALRPRVYQIVRSVCADAELAQDITQDALLRVWQGLPTYNPSIAPFRNWLSRVVIRCAYNALEQQARLTRRERREADWASPDADDAPRLALEQVLSGEAGLVEQAAERERLSRILALAQATLSPDEYLAWLEQTVNGSSCSEIALLLERNENWTRQTLVRARQKLAAAMVLDPALLSDAEIQEAIRRCQHSANPLTPQELRLLQACLGGKTRCPPPWRHTLRFRLACVKLLAHTPS
ncbi:MAG: RNA polymerase sigma factor [Fimbriimonadales bacterium]|nr:RNA polymerase sigma factor [Fimbriimonadales bacterium]